MADLKQIRTLKAEMEHHLVNGILPFWMDRSIDEKYGGFITSIDGEGNISGDTEKYLVTQCRMIWGFSAAARRGLGNPRSIDAAKRGFDFLVNFFWDESVGGWVWKTDRPGAVLDFGKIVYGQSFAIYALSEYFLAFRDQKALALAEKTFELLRIHAADSRYGGYLENFESDWSLSTPGFNGGDRKSLDIHMHLMESFTTLAKASGKEHHLRALAECSGLIVDKMVDLESGCGLNQFDTAFVPIPAISIRRTWNAERKSNEHIDRPMDSTSYGHNVELFWLFRCACEILGKSSPAEGGTLRPLLDHCLRYGLDLEYGGVFRDGPHRGEAYVKDKEWWQNAEALVGFLDAYVCFGDQRYFNAFVSIWNFAKNNFIDKDMGEWRQLLDRTGKPMVSDLGNPWKGIYHTGRAAMECVDRLKILELEEER